MLTEEELVAGCIRQDRKIQHELYQQYEGLMYHTCRRYVRGPAAEDILVKGFYKVFQSLHRFQHRGQGSLQKWIRKIMVNEALMYLRKYHQQELSLDAATVVPAPERSDGPLLAEELYELIRQLPPGYRTVFNLYSLEGYTHKEIASQLGIAESTSKSQLRKARLLLQQWINRKTIIQ